MRRDEDEFHELPDPLTKSLKDLFGLDYLFPYQRLVISNILEAAGAPDGEDRSLQGNQVVILPTGAGKSLCFQLPAMLLPGPTLVIYPILSLMADQERRLSERGFSPVTLRGGQAGEEREEIWRKVALGEARFIIANPEVLLSPAVMKKLPDIGLSHLVVDEAHCVSEWGESFRKDYLRIGEIVKAVAPPGKLAPVVTAFTATASGPVLEKIERYIFGGPARRVVGNPDRPNIRYAALEAILPDLAVRDLLAANEKPAIVFCSSRKGTEKLARRLRAELGTGEVYFYHAGLSRGEKDAVEKWFFKSADGVLVATCAYGMGVDKANVRTVIHRDMPPSVEAYLQESGRAGRDGKPSRAFAVYDTGRPPRAKTENDRARLQSLLDYAADISRCRRGRLLDLLGYQGERPETLECCDVCDAHREGKALPRGPREEASVTDFIRRNARRFTLNEAAFRLAAAGLPGLDGEGAGLLLDALVRRGKIKASRSPFFYSRLIPAP
jgi:ATP-dependent DNA helicase RecQ